MKVKGGEWESFPVCSNAVDVIKRAIGNRTEGYVFINPKTDTRYYSTSQSIRKAIRKLNLKVGDSYLKFHDIRHLFATWLHEKGVSLDILRVLLGHQHRSTTDRYTTAKSVSAENVLSLKPKIERHNRLSRH